MPGLDGFGVLEELRLDRRTQHIPIIIISAKDITLQERERLNGYIKAIYQKGSLTPRSLVNQVVEVLENKTANKGES